MLSLDVSVNKYCEGVGRCKTENSVCDDGCKEGICRCSIRIKRWYIQRTAINKCMEREGSEVTEEGAMGTEVMTKIKNVTFIEWRSTDKASIYCPSLIATCKVVMIIYHIVRWEKINHLVLLLFPTQDIHDLFMSHPCLSGWCGVHLLETVNA